MKTYLTKVGVGNSKILTNPFGYNSLVKLHEKCSDIYESKIDLDFSDTKWIDANMTTLLGAIIYRNKKLNGNSFVTNAKVIKKKFPILFANGFLGDPQFKNHNAVRFESFLVKDDIKFMDYIFEELLSHSSLRLTLDDKSILAAHYAEIFTNVEKHALTEEHIFACGQYYPKNKRLRFSLIDIGVGYFEPIKEYTKRLGKESQIITPDEALKWAVSGVNTTKEFGGIGLKDLYQFCNEKSSIFQIVSDGRFWTSSTNEVTNVKPFPGSMVNVIIKCD